ncbi:metallopeptidase family protein [Propionibacterium freudenreichii]|uniref:metallopeptidase family protein n=1 Tax=Propionibacterium freudenreichii TaxID=1744 RepID=UPI0005A5C425|nr:metallopeptidase family protein [Propionibacterium freudenreichii]CEI29914.1 Hypothetical protein PFCIRM456_01445 [Propionibacterium freudenreichii]
MRTRDRHGRGLRGPLALPNPYTHRPMPVPQAPRGTRLFLACVEDAIARVASHAPDVIRNVDIGVDEVPDVRALWSNGDYGDAIPLASATDAQPGQNARIVLFRRPLEHRAADQSQLRELVHETLVDQLAALTGRSIDEIDPDDGDQ